MINNPSHAEWYENITEVMSNIWCTHIQIKFVK